MNVWHKFQTKQKQNKKTPSAEEISRSISRRRSNMRDILFWKSNNWECRENCPLKSDEQAVTLSMVPITDHALIADSQLARSKFALFEV